VSYLPPLQLQVRQQQQAWPAPRAMPRAMLEPRSGGESLWTGEDSRKSGAAFPCVAPVAERPSVAGSAQRTGESVDWARRLTAAGAFEGSPTESGCGVEGVAEPSTVTEACVYWNVRLLDGKTAVNDMVVTSGRLYQLTTGLDSFMFEDAVAAASVAGEQFRDSTEVHFSVSCAEPILRMPGETASLTHVQAKSIYRRESRGCPPVVFELVPTKVGPLTLILSLSTNNAIRGGQRIPLTVCVPSQQTAVRLPGLPPRPATSISAAALSGPSADLRLILTGAGEIEISTSARVGRPRPPASDWSVLTSEAIRARAALVSLSRRYRAEHSADSPFALVDAQRMCFEMAEIGARLHEKFFGHPDDAVMDSELRRLAQSIADTPDTAGVRVRLQIGATYQPFPWAVLYDGAYRGRPLTDVASVDPTCFWGERFRIDRAIVGNQAGAFRAPIIRGTVRVQQCLNPYLDEDQQDEEVIGVVDAQRRLFKDLPNVLAQPCIESAEGFATYLEAQDSGPCDLLYFFCHATAAKSKTALFTFTTEDPEQQAKLIFGPGGGHAVDVAAMKAKRRKPLADRPLIFLNACSTAAGDEAFQGQFLAQFLDRWQAAGLIGTDWEVPTVFADEFARRLLNYFVRDRLPLGDAFANASRDAFDQGNPFALVYALYAPPNFVISSGGST
jgi:hypothetical protein